MCLFFGTLGLIQLDVMADTMVVERSKFEPDENKGKEQMRGRGKREEGREEGRRGEERKGRR